MNISDKFTISFIVGPERKNEFLNAWWSCYDLNPQINNSIIFFNPYVIKDHEFFLEDVSTNHAQIVKFNRFHSIAQCWNLSIIFSNTPYVIISNDDVVFKDIDLLDKIYEKHLAGYKLVHVTENWSCFSIHKSLILDIGWFDEMFAHSWEDSDMRFRLNRANIKDFRFHPYLVRHLRSKKGNNQSYWDESSGYFFDKWGIKDYQANKYNVPMDFFDDPNNRRKLQSAGFFRNIDPKVLHPKWSTLNFYPKGIKDIKSNL